MFNYLEVIDFKRKKDDFINNLMSIIDNLFYYVSDSELIIQFPDEYSYIKSKNIVKINNTEVLEDIFIVGKLVDTKLDNSEMSIEYIQENIDLFQNKLKKNIIQNSLRYKDCLKEMFNKYGFIETSSKSCDILNFFSYSYLIYKQVCIKNTYLDVLREEDYDKKLENINKLNRKLYIKCNKTFEFFDLIYPNYIYLKCIFNYNKGGNYLVFNNLFQMALSSIKEQIETRDERKMKKCINCHKLFIQKRANQLYCSRKENRDCFLDRQNKRKFKSKNNRK